MATSKNERKPDPGDFTVERGETRVVIRFSSSPAHYHLIEVYAAGRGSAVLQIKYECPREVVAQLAAHIAGLGV